MEPGTSREAQARSGCPTAVCRHHDSPAAAAAEAGEKAAQCGQAGGAERRKESEEELDPRIQDELEHLNQASDDINKLELQLDDARSSYRRILTDSARKLNAQGSQLGACIEKARPYYEARRLAKEAQKETQKAALRYERAVSMHTAAREMVYVAEQGLLADKNTVDSTWQEMLNHATAKVNEAEEERLCSEQEHQRVTLLCQDAEARVQTLQKSLRKAILKSKPYFELKAQFNHILEEHKAKVLQLEEQVSKVKTRYFVALRNLEQISEQIHAQRAQSVAPEGRSSPVGAEAEVQGAAAAPVSTCVGVSGIESAWAGGEKTRLWVERHRESGWGQRERLEAEPATVVSLQTTASDLEKCDSLEHLGDLGDGGSELGEEWGCHQNRPLSRGIMTGGSQLDKGGVCEEMQDSLIKQHQRSFSL
ncbi:SH3 domain-binding protein 5-like isoform X1 [Austrofundulus limnaeus]|uniref:SH3 domain-binding protein 5 n=1 Tax=Austrofundulus limnaeus TaxID=52670 RepID=A0A2I4CQD5_AUSLI|nr:PREDICTED: SH3 domain-binding protein 5-like isoform X1 [Austrofundulus limnaeus]XP_013882211.1 PREDICTED: SH3 domain-binding protein 5-like isoform X1 [Austrofundulus limnaeus]